MVQKLINLPHIFFVSMLKHSLHALSNICSTYYSDVLNPPTTHQETLTGNESSTVEPQNIGTTQQQQEKPFDILLR